MCTDRGLFLPASSSTRGGCILHPCTQAKEVAHCQHTSAWSPLPAWGTALPTLSSWGWEDVTYRSLALATTPHPLVLLQGLQSPYPRPQPANLASVAGVSWRLKGFWWLNLCVMFLFVRSVFFIQCC